MNETNQNPQDKEITPNKVNTTSLKKKIWMLASTTEMFSILPKIGTLEQVQKAKHMVQEAKDLFNNNNLDEAKAKAKEIVEAVKENCQLLPKTAKKMVKNQLEKISKY